MSKSLALASILIGFFSARVSATRAQESPASALSISGTVQDPSGAVVPQARIVLQSANANEPQDTISDSNGNFHFDKLPAGPYRLTIQSPGFKDELLTVKIVDPRLGIPYRFHYGFGVERQVTTKSTFSPTYVGSRGIDLFRSTDANAPLVPNFS